MRRVPVPSRTVWRCGLLASGLLLAIGGGVAGAKPLAQPGPALGIGDVSAAPGASVDVPIRFTSDGHAISTLLFSIDYDSSILVLDPADADGNGIPDAIALSLPAGLVATAQLDTTDVDGELDMLITGVRAPLPAVPDGTLVVLTFQPQGGKATDGATTTLRFASAPPASFGSTTGQSVPGSATGGTVRWSTTPAQPAATSGAASTTVPTSAALPGRATPTQRRPGNSGAGAPAPSAPAAGLAGAPGLAGPTRAAATMAGPGRGTSGAARTGTAAGTPAAATAGPTGAAGSPVPSDIPGTPAPGVAGTEQALATALGSIAQAPPAAGSALTTPEPGAPASAGTGATAVAGADGAASAPAGGAPAAGQATTPATEQAGSGRGWLIAIVGLAVLVGVWLAYRRRSAGELDHE